MAAIRGLSSVLLSAAVAAQWHSPCSLSSRLCPLLIQTRHKKQQNVRHRAPNQPKQKEKWIKGIKTKSTRLSVESTKRTYSAEFLARVPEDDVWLRMFYPEPKFSVEEALVRHKEFADPSMLDNLDGFVFADMELNMKTKKKTKFLSNITGTVLLPNVFEQSGDRKIAIFCKKEEDLQKAQKLGATYIGGADLVKQISEGIIDKDDIDAVLCTPDVITELLPIRSLLRDKFPNKTKGNIGSDLDGMWMLHTEGVVYNSQKESEAVGKLQVPLGQLKMTVDQLVENFHTYIDDLFKGRSTALGPFITEVSLIAPPSKERFLLPVEDYVLGYRKSKAGEDSEDSDDEDERTARAKQR